MLGDVALLCLHADYYDKAKEVFMKVMKEKDQLIGTPSPESAEMMIDACIKRNDAKLAIVRFVILSYFFQR